MVIGLSGVQFGLKWYIQVINKIGWPQSGGPICQLWVWLQTQLEDRKSCYQLIITVTISENNKCI